MLTRRRALHLSFPDLFLTAPAWSGKWYTPFQRTNQHTTSELQAARSSTCIIAQSNRVSFDADMLSTVVLLIFKARCHACNCDAPAGLVCPQTPSPVAPLTTWPVQRRQLHASMGATASAMMTRLWGGVQGARGGMGMRRTTVKTLRTTGG